MEKRQIWLLSLILIIAFFLRFWHLGKVPPSPDWDEASLGYNAYSILKTGRDEYGKTLPLIFRSFGDYKPGLYVYLIIPFIKIFGLNTFVVRFPSALLGTLAVLLTYYLVKELFPSISPRRSAFAHHPRCLRLPLLTAFLLAISPWHIQFSRVAFESNLGLFFNIFWVFLFIKGLKKPLYLIFAAFFAGLNIYSYQAEKVFTPLLVLAAILISRKESIKIPKKYLVSSLIVGLTVISPFIYMVFSTPEIFLRAKGTSIASDQTPFLARTVEKLSRDYKNNDFLGLILNNRRLTYLLAFINGYLSHFDLNWLFITGDETRHHAPGMGLLYLWELPFLLIGTYQLIFGKISKKSKTLLFSWFLLAPLPASFTSGVPHAVRTLRFLPVLPIFVALGLVKFWQMIKNKKVVFKFLVCVFSFLFLIFNFLYYLNQYFVQQNYFNSQSWQYGYQEAVEEVKKIETNYEKVIISNQPHLDQSYIFFLFYLKFDPAAYQELQNPVIDDLGRAEHRFSKYIFRPIEWTAPEKEPKTLYVGRPEDFPPEAKIIKTIPFLNGEPAIIIAENR